MPKPIPFPIVMQAFAGALTGKQVLGSVRAVSMATRGDGDKCQKGGENGKPSTKYLHHYQKKIQAQTKYAMPWGPSLWTDADQSSRPHEEAMNKED